MKYFNLEFMKRKVALNSNSNYLLTGGNHSKAANLTCGMSMLNKHIS